MNKKATLEALEELHGALVKALVEKVKNGTATAADLGVARQLLRDNNVDAIPKEGSPLDDLHKSLPFPSKEGVEAEENTRH